MPELMILLFVAAPLLFTAIILARLSRIRHATVRWLGLAACALSPLATYTLFMAGGGGAEASPGSFFHWWKAGLLIMGLPFLLWAGAVIIIYWTLSRDQADDT